MKNHFVYAFQGNKRTEVEQIYDKIKSLLKGKTTIIEPYCGSCAISFYIWKYKNNNYQFILNDTNKILTDLLTIIKAGKLIALVNDVNAMCFDADDKFIPKIRYNEILKDQSISPDIRNFITNKLCGIRPGLYPIRNMKKMDIDKFDNDFIEFIKSDNVIIKTDDAVSLINDNLDNDKCIMLLDPPYLDTDNTKYRYSKGGCNIYKEITEKDKYINSTTNIVFILESMWIVDAIFRKWHSYKYNKTYSGTKKKQCQHVIISNKTFTDDNHMEEINIIPSKDLILCIIYKQMEQLKVHVTAVESEMNKTTKKSKTEARKHLMDIIKLCKQMRVDLLDKKPVIEEPEPEPVEPEPVIKKPVPVPKTKKTKTK